MEKLCKKCITLCVHGIAAEGAFGAYSQALGLACPGCWRELIPVKRWAVRTGSERGRGMTLQVSTQKARLCLCWRPLLGALVWRNQAMETAMKANKKISTAPASGNTSGISGTTASTASAGWVSWGCAGADMGKAFAKVMRHSNFSGQPCCGVRNKHLHGLSTNRGAGASIHTGGC